MKKLVLFISTILLLAASVAMGAQTQTPKADDSFMVTFSDTSISTGDWSSTSIQANRLTVQRIIFHPASAGESLVLRIGSVTGAIIQLDSSDAEGRTVDFGDKGKKMRLYFIRSENTSVSATSYMTIIEPD